MKLRRSSRRLAWVGLVNGVSIFGLVTGGFTVNNVVLMTALLAGIGLELRCSVWAAAFNVGAFLFVPVGWMWEWSHDAHSADYSGEYGFTLVVVVVPCLIIAVVNLML